MYSESLLLAYGMTSRRGDSVEWYDDTVFNDIFFYDSDIKADDIHAFIHRELML
jgi:hypothetical protein